MINLTTDQLITLLCLPGIGPARCLELLSTIKSNICKSDDLFEYVKVFAKNKQSLFTKDDFNNAKKRAEQIIFNTQKNKAIKTITFNDDKYPKALKLLRDFPIVLNYIGNIEVLSKRPTVAIVGTRKASKLGLATSKIYGEFFALNGYNVASGLALGCDSAAHLGALKAEGITVAILAQGLDKIYPVENANLADEIVEKGGLLLTEFFCGDPMKHYNFIKRNRIQVGLSRGVLVIETSLQGGTMQTAKMCIANNKPLAAIKYPTNLQATINNEGNNKLINDNAISIEKQSDAEIFLKTMQQLDLTKIKKTTSNYQNILL